jgi:hypothetical protein
VDIAATKSGELFSIVRPVAADGESDLVKFTFTNRSVVAAEYGRVIVEGFDDSLPPPGFDVDKEDVVELEDAAAPEDEDDADSEADSGSGSDEDAEEEDA